MKEQSEAIEQAGSASAAKQEKRQKRGETPQQHIRKAKKVTRQRFSAEDKIGIIMEGMHGEEPVSVLCRRLGLQTTVYYRWLKDFMEAGKQRLRGDTLREAGHDEVRALKEENGRLKQLVADYALEVMALKKSLLGER